LPSFGEKLKLEREKRKITLEQISSSTKIGTRMLQALEEDKFNQLPGGIFNKGFVRAYSRAVGLDEDQTVAEYLQASGDAPPVRIEAVGRETAVRETSVRETERRNADRRNIDNRNDDENIRLDASAETASRPLPWGWFAAILLIVALALSFWSHHRRDHARSQIQPSSAVVPDNSVSSPTTGSATPPSSSTPTASTKPVRPMAGSIPTATKTKELNAAAPGEFTVVIQARDESWISITADGKSVESELLAAGDERTIHGRKEVVVRAGNAGGVDFRFNGKKIETGGDYGEVKTVTFGPAGMVPTSPPSPQASPQTP
jgi:cytoskeleton protein RodZ